MLLPPSRPASFESEAMNLEKSIEDRVEAAREAMQDIMRRFSLPGAKPVSLRDEAYAVLERHGLCYVACVMNEQVGTHPRNRGGIILEIQNVILKLHKFAKNRFSFDECARACAVERPHGCLGNQYEKVVQALAMKANGQLMPVANGSLRIFSITCSHTKEALRAAVWGVPCEDPELSQNGFVSKALLAEKDEALGKAIAHGISWRIIKWPCEKVWPGLIDLIIQGDNLPFAAAKLDTPLSICWRIVETAKQRMDRSTHEIPWSIVAEDVGRAVSASEEDIASYVEFVRHSSGGLDPPHVLRDVDEFVKTRRRARDPPAKVLERFSSLDFPPNVCVLWRGAAIKALMAATEAVHGNAKGESKYFSPNDISLMSGSYRQYVLQADEILKQACISLVSSFHLFLCVYEHVCSLFSFFIPFLS